MQYRRQKRVEHAQREGRAHVEPHRLQKQPHQRRLDETSDQVVEDFETREPRETALEQVRQNLPVAARPAVQPLEVGGKRLREAVVERYVRDERRARILALDQVVAQYPAVGQRPLERVHERAHVVDALAREAAGAREVLVEVRHRHRVRVDAAGAREQPDELVRRGGCGELHVRLQYREAPADAVERPRPVQRVQHRADERPDRAGDHPRVGVDRHDEPVAPGELLARRALGLKRALRAGDAEQQPVQFHQRAALALVPHEAAVGRVEGPVPVQVQVFLAPRAAVHLADARAADLENLPVGRLARGVGVAEVAQQQVLDVFVGVEAAERLEPVEQFARAAGGAQKRRHHDERRLVALEALDLELEQPVRANDVRRDPADHHHRRAPRKRYAEHKRREALREQRVADKQQDGERYDRGDQFVPLRVGHELRDAAAYAEPADERLAAPVVVEPPADRRARVARRELLRRGDRLVRDRLLADLEPLREQADLRAHGRARLVVHPRICAVRVAHQFGLGARELPEALLPVERVDHALRGHEVVQAHAQKRLGLVLQADQLLPALPHPGDLALEPGAQFRYLLLDGQFQRPLVKRGRVRVPPGASALRVDEPLGLGPLPAALDDRARVEAERLGERAAERRRRGPYLGHRQRLHVVERREREHQPVGV
ncbi:MAG: hypothetical protein BWY81_01636 [Firmicutes bacterium ADurb.Bin467]|nr:MAG: hypothetical protein BWY81_01636 [Firmicutes bacterium ADurb.Bin467]